VTAISIASTIQRTVQILAGDVLAVAGVEVVRERDRVSR